MCTRGEHPNHIYESTESRNAIDRVIICSFVLLSALAYRKVCVRASFSLEFSLRDELDVVKHRIGRMADDAEPETRDNSREISVRVRVCVCVLQRLDRRLMITASCL